MKKTTFLKVILLTFMFLQSFLSISQNVVPFTRRFDQDIKGDMLLIGNSILNRRSATRNPNDPYNGNNLNSDFSMEFINVDNGATPGIFNSSSANLVVPNPVATSAPCYKIVYAALYWGAVTRGTTPVTNVRFRMPSGGYNDVVGTVIHNSTTPIGTSLPYACVADVTSLVTGTGNPNPEGTYTLANVSTAQGTNGGTGLSAGWSLYIVYEDPKLPAKSITSYDGFSAISSTVNLDIPVTNFRTIPVGPVRGKFAFSALEGDSNIAGDNLSINGTLLSAANSVPTNIRPNTNFFNSSVTYIDPATGITENYLNRTPNSSNTLGYDAGILNIPNNGNVIIDNNDTSALIGLRSSQDVYFYYFNAIALDIIAPNIVLTKQVFSDASLTNDVGNQNVTRGQELHYAIGFQNIGNDNAENFTITDVLPININFDPNDIVVPNNSGITYVYTAATRTIVFTVPKNLVVVSAPRYRIRFKVRVVSECNELSDVCSNSIQNQAFADYQGEASGIRVDDQRSLATFGACFLGTPAPTNFLVGLDDCIYTRNYQLCGASVVLTAANGYDAYSWSTSPSGTPVIGTTQSITVTQTGTFYVTNFATAPCRTIRQVVTVSPAGSAVTNPVIPFATQTVTCPNNGKLLPKIFLCGANASRLITTGVSDAISIQWQRLNEASCPPVGSDDCANEQTSCTWTTVATGQNYTADTSGQYRVVFNYAGGCFNIFYFNVFKNLLDPTADSRDIICNTTGQITVGGVPATGYEFSLNATGPFQTSNVFPISTPGAYTVYIRQQGVVSNPCLFEVPGIDIRRRNFTVSEFVTQPLCNGDRGTIRLAANDVRGQYSYILRRNGTIVNSSILTNNNFFDFPNLTSGTYTYEVTTEDGCLGTGSIEIREPDILTATVNLTKSLTCESGEITVAPVGGTLPYAIYVNGATTPQFAYQINTPTAGLYDLLIIDANGCRTTTSINVASVPTPVYNTEGTNVNCYGDTTGVINFNMTADNGYTVTYSIDNGLNYGTSGLISGLAAGTYNTILKYTLNGVECLEPMRPITITQPSTALTASAGVSELAGCGPAGEGRVRITNVQGGVAPYEFSFDNQGSWTTVNNALKAPGNYILYVRDRNNCIFQAPVTVDPAPAIPNINVGTPVDFNCDGTATSIVTVNNPGNINYTYNYFIDGVQNPNTPSNIFLNVTPGTHAIRIDYQLSTVTTFSNLLNEDFGIGANTTTPGIAAAYCFHNLDVVPSTCTNPALTLEDNQYVVTRGLVPNNSAWFPFRDHTTAGANPNGRFLAVNIGGAAGANGVLYSKVINDIIPNQPVIVEAYVANLFRANFVGGVDPSFSFELVDSSGNVVAQQPPIPPTPNPTGIPPIPTIPRSNNWVLRSVSLNPGNNTSLTFRVRSGSTEYSGNDAAIDDIRVYQLPRACVTSRTINIEVPTGRAFAAQVNGQRNVSCAGGADGGFTITAQNFDATTGFEYSLNNGGTWSATQLTSPVVINTLGVNSYNVLVRPVGSTVTACSKSFTVNITAPAAVTAAAAILTPATCTTGATIRATGGGGTPAYQYELRDSNGTSVITAFNTSRDFTNVPAGDYTVFVRDANNCTNPAGASISVIAPPGVTATLATTTDYCFTTANPATLVVNVSGGTGPFTYQLDSNTAESSALTTYPFPNVTPGTHTIVVTDSNNCTSTISNIVIAPQLGFNVSLINDLTCLVDASIGNPVITNGYGPTYTYTVSRDSGTPTAVTSFPYTATQAGSYVFTVTDSRGCPATSNPIVVTPKTTPTHITAKTDITCNGLNNGTITVTPSGGFTTTYTYAIKLSTATAYTTQATSQFTSLAAGTYDIKVIDSKGCESTPTQVTIINPTPIVPNASATAFSCSPTNAPQSATITVAPTGGTGTGTYTYSYNNGGSFGPSNTLTVNNNGSVQTIRVVVRDANGCLSPMQQIDVQPLNSPTNLTFSNAAVTCTATTTTVSVTATNGVGALTFLITGTNSGTANSNFGPITTAGSSVAASFPNLLPGNYTFRVTDANGCYYTESHNIDPVTPIAVAANKTSDVLCQGGSTGSGTYTVSGNATVGAFTYTPTTFSTGTLTQSGNVLTLSNVAAGTYTVRVTDTATGCFADGTITINQPAAPLAITNAVATNFNCNNDNAQITVTASGGTTAYGYAAVPATPAT
ncbi:SprB repeat-containing protein, partial [Flavobacterium sp. FPG59]|uniref:SprB repeat-containing protein n=1 Tax=Flavobacterium sp. FPG59 TaxID=1929267 RepID=UPI000A382697